MKKLLILFTVMVVACLTGCGSTNMLRSGENADFVLVSEGELGGAYSYFAGDGKTCKVTEFGKVERWQVTYNGERCHAVLNGGAVERAPDADSDDATPANDDSSESNEDDD